VHTFASTLSRWSAIGLGFSLPISIAVDNLLVVTALLGWLVAGNLTYRLGEIRNHPVAMAAVLFAVVMAVGMSWSPRDLGEQRESIVEVLYFMFVGVLVLLFADERARRHALAAFLASSALVLAISFLLWIGIAVTLPGMKGYPGYPVAFKFHITHNVLMAVAAVLYLLLATRTQRRARWFFVSLAVAAVFNVLFMIPGRTGQLALVVVLIYIAYSRFRLPGLLAGSSIMACVVALAWWAPNSVMQQRAATAIEEASAWRSEQAQSMHSSVGLRLEFYRNSVQMILERPLLGTGTGGFRLAYAEHVADKGMVVTDHPHNAFLLVGVELGLLGLAALGWLLYVQWRTAGELPSRTDCIAARSLLVVFVVSGLVSSTFNDHVEGLFFVWASALLWAPLDRISTS